METSSGEVTLAMGPNEKTLVSIYDPIPTKTGSVFWHQSKWPVPTSLTYTGPLNPGSPMFLLQPMTAPVALEGTTIPALWRRCSDADKSLPEWLLVTGLRLEETAAGHWGVTPMLGEIKSAVAVRSPVWSRSGETWEAKFETTPADHLPWAESRTLSYYHPYRVVFVPPASL